MEELNKTSTFFLGANTPKGFVSFFDELYNPFDDWSFYIIKGGPGTGKSGIMNRVADRLEGEGLEVERIICSSDPSSLDGVIFPEIKTSIGDGTAPHIMEPKFPGAVEQIINLGDYWNSAKLRANAEEIRKTHLKNSAFHQHCVRFLNAAGSLYSDTYRLATECTDKDKIINFAKRFAARQFGTLRGKVGHEKKRFLSAISPVGVYTNYETIEKMCDNIIAINDEYGVASNILLGELRRHALSAGLDIITCICPMSPKGKIEHLIIPQTGLCIFTANSHHSAPKTVKRHIHSRRFMDVELLKTHAYRMSFNRKAGADLLAEAINLLAQAKSTHDALESFYIDAMDFNKVDEKAEAIISEILKGDSFQNRLKWS